MGVRKILHVESYPLGGSGMPPKNLDVLRLLMMVSGAPNGWKLTTEYQKFKYVGISWYLALCMKPRLLF